MGACLHMKNLNPLRLNLEAILTEIVNADWQLKPTALLNLLYSIDCSFRIHCSIRVSKSVFQNFKWLKSEPA